MNIFKAITFYSENEALNEIIEIIETKREENSLIPEYEDILLRKFFNIADQKVVEFSQKVMDHLYMIDIDALIRGCTCYYIRNLIVNFSELIELTMGWKKGNSTIEIPENLTIVMKVKDSVLLRVGDEFFFVSTYIIEGEPKKIVSKVEQSFKPKCIVFEDLNRALRGFK